MGCGVCPMFFENTLYLTRDLMEDSAFPSNLSVPKVPEPDWAATFAGAKNKKGPKLGEHVQLFRMKQDRNKGSTLKSANLRPPPYCALNQLGILCRGTCSRCFTILSRAPNGVSNEHSRSDRINSGPNYLLDTGRGVTYGLICQLGGPI